MNQARKCCVFNYAVILNYVRNYRKCEYLVFFSTGLVLTLRNLVHLWYRLSFSRYFGISYHGYAMRKILPLCIKTVTCKSKGFLCLFGHNSRIHCFCLKILNLFSQNITFKVIDYLNLVEKNIRNRNVDEVSVPIISKDIRQLIFINPPWKELMVQWSEHIRLINSYQLLISGRCTNTGGRMKGSLWPVATCS